MTSHVVSLLHVADLLRIARRCVWFLPPDQALDHPAHFIAHVLTYGTHDDVRTLRQYASDEMLIAALDQAPPGVFDGRSWAYWHLKLKGVRAPPPLPERRLPGAVTRS